MTPMDVMLIELKDSHPDWMVGYDQDKKHWYACNNTLEEEYTGSLPSDAVRRAWLKFCGKDPIRSK